MVNTEINLQEMACDIIRQYLVEQFEDMEFNDVAYEDPDANDLLDGDWDILLDNMRRAKVNIVVTL